MQWLARLASLPACLVHRCEVGFSASQPVCMHSTSSAVEPDHLSCSRTFVCSCRTWPEACPLFFAASASVAMISGASKLWSMPVPGRALVAGGQSNVACHNFKLVHVNIRYHGVVYTQAAWHCCCRDAAAMPSLLHCAGHTLQAHLGTNGCHAVQPSNVLLLSTVGGSGQRTVAAIAAAAASARLLIAAGRPWLDHEARQHGGRKRSRHVVPPCTHWSYSRAWSVGSLDTQLHAWRWAGTDGSGSILACGCRCGSRAQWSA